MSLRVSVAAETGQRFPRVSGDEPIMLILTDNIFQFSPRERG